MLFRQSYSLNILEPCHQSWRQMQPAAEGRYCTHCSKTVTDFTGKTEQEIADFFRHKPQQVCGRFRHEQLQKTYSASVVQVLPVHRRVVRYLLGLLLTGGNVEKGNAQEPGNVLQKDSMVKDSALVIATALEPDSLALCDDTTQVARSADSLATDAVKIKWDWQPGICVSTPTYVISTEIIISGAISVEPPERKVPLDYLLDSLELMARQLGLKPAVRKARPIAILPNSFENKPRKAPLKLPPQEAIMAPVTVWRPKKSGRTKNA